MQQPAPAPLWWRAVQERHLAAVRLLRQDDQALRALAAPPRLLRHVLHSQRQAPPPTESTQGSATCAHPDQNSSMHSRWLTKRTTQCAKTGGAKPLARQPPAARLQEAVQRNEDACARGARLQVSGVPQAALAACRKATAMQWRRVMQGPARRTLHGQLVGVDEVERLGHRDEHLVVHALGHALLTENRCESLSAGAAWRHRLVPKLLALT